MVNAVRHPNGGTQPPAHAAKLAKCVDLDMADWWAPTRDSYLGRIPKSRILEAVSQGASEKAADDIAGLKKDAMIDHAERLLAVKRWLPEVLRGPESVAVSSELAA